MKETTKKKYGGFAMRLTQAIVYVLMCCVGVATLIYGTTLTGPESYDIIDRLLIFSIPLMCIGFVFAILQFICAFNGKYRDANVTSIVLSSIFILDNLICNIFVGNVYNLICATLGVFGVIGGSQGLKKGQFELPSGNALRTFQAIIWLLATTGLILGGVLVMIFGEFSSEVLFIGAIFLGVAAFVLILTIIQFVIVRKGKKSLKANTTSIVVNAIFSVCVIGIPGVVGGVQGKKFLKAYPDGIVPKATEEETTAASVTEAVAVQHRAITDSETNTDVLDTVDYSIPSDCGKIFSLTSGSNIVEVIRCSMSGIEADVNGIGIFDADGSELEAQIGGYKIEQKGDTNRLYLIVKGMSGENEILCLFYVVQLVNGEYGLVEEHDEAIREIIHNWLSASASTDEPTKSKGKKFFLVLGGFFLGLFKAIANIGKDVLKFFGSAFGDTAFGKAFKRGYNGEDEEVQTYTVINDMGCEQTVYTRDGKYFYDISGEFVGESHDGGKTIIWK